ncbi:hypothetical protein C0081_16360 [Cohaesibacter celericrescens]|uniref:Uncharacterized protein n=1 Tax=Cohaesibacter celericrescens TaxID=2067669 RepID=A0A2N5XPK0_9HYPH|nr:hypothetical protein C0081_16360 [Cohaesibacter celericrescens]
MDHRCGCGQGARSGLFAAADGNKYALEIFLMMSIVAERLGVISVVGNCQSKLSKEMIHA